MERETMLYEGDEHGQLSTKNSHPSERATRRRTNWVRFASVCLVVALIAGLAAVGLMKWMPSTEEANHTVLKKGVIEEFAFNAVFSTDYIGKDPNQLLDVTNIKDIENQFNTKTRKNHRLRIIGAFLRPRSASQRMKCTKPLPGYLLQLDLLVPSLETCSNQTDRNCIIRHQKILNDILKTMVDVPLDIEFDSAVTEQIKIKLCNIYELTQEEDRIIAEPVPAIEKVESPLVSSVIKPKQGIFRQGNGGIQSYSGRSSRCNLCINMIGLVNIPGEFNSKIDDDVRSNNFQSGMQNQQHMVVSVYEESYYRLHVQLDCGGHLDRSTLESSCSRSLSVFVWIDYNDNNIDDREGLKLRRAWSENSTPTGIYEIEIRIPTIDGRDVKSGRHRMRITVLPTEEFQRECSHIKHIEIRDYTIHIFPKLRPTTIPTTPYRDPMCFLNFPKIILVLMAGEKGTEIRDDIPKNSLMNNHPNRHHVAVTLFEQTVYLIRIQLDCSTQLSTDLTRTGCNLAQDVFVSIDLNNDGRFDSSELASPYRWPVTSYMAEGIYDLQVSVPARVDQYVRQGTLRMRVLVLPSDYYIRNCGYSAYNETREYMLDIIPRMKYSVLAAQAPPPVVITNFECSSDVGKVVLVVMAGEYRTQIRDDVSTRAAANMINRIEQHRSIVLYEEITYLLRIQLECTSQRDRGYLRTNCTLPHEVNAWIDLNDDGVFDSSEIAAPYRWPMTSYVPEGVYDLQIYVPIIDGNKVRSGPHLMRITVTLNEQYRQKCGKNYFSETREYNVTIVRPNSQLADTGLPYLTLNDNVCSQTNGKIVLVIMTGEIGTHIRDDTPLNTLIGDNQNRHHLAVTLYENTVYRIRIQLDCDRPSSKGSYDINCNLAQDVNIFIDHNNDGKFDDSESHVPHRWPLLNSMGLGIYDLDVSIPSINDWNMKAGAHRMRVVVMPSEEQNRKCGRTGSQEVREYTFNIIPRVATYSNVILQPGHCSPGNLVCSNTHGAINLVRFIGEQYSKIDDDSRVCSSTNNYDDQHDLSVTLFDNKIYTLRIELSCAKQESSDYGNSYDDTPSDDSCKQASYLHIWIDFNDDGVFDENREQVSSTDRYNGDNRQSQRDLSISIPPIDGRQTVAGQHRMRVILNHDDRSRGACHNSGTGEARDYTVNIIQK